MNKIIHCPTKEDWKRVVQKLLDDGCNWNGGEGTNLNFWTSYEEKSCVSVEERTLEFSPKSYYQRKFPNIPIITADEFMGEFKVGDRVEIINTDSLNGVTGTISEIENKLETKIWCEEWSDGGGRDWMPPKNIKLIDEGKEESYIIPDYKMPDYSKMLFNLWNYEDTPPTESKIKTMLNRIPRTLKRVLSPDLQKQYKAGLINGDLELTEKGREEMFDILSQEDVVKKGLTKFAEEIIKKAKKKD